MKQFNEVSNFGFGLMRLPKNGDVIDVEQVKSMVDTYMEAGLNYFDTALIYPGSENAIRQALVDRYPRSSYQLATKIKITTPELNNYEDCVKAFNGQLERLGVDYFDFYLMHAIRTDAGYEKNLKLGFLDFLRQKKQENVIKHIGFSFHGGPKLLRRILDEQNDIEFVQIQLNYADWDSTCAYSGELYDILNSRNIPIIVMEPIKGGLLANPSPEIAEVLWAANPNKELDQTSYFAALALRFVASLDGIMTTLSGMSNMEQMKANLSTFQNITPITEDEQKAIKKANEILYSSNQIQCTKCEYCVEGCPKHINIPYMLSLVNSIRRTPADQLTKNHYKNVPDEFKAHNCIKCKKCEISCPQGLNIIEFLEEAKVSLNPARV